MPSTLGPSTAPIRVIHSAGRRNSPRLQRRDRRRSAFYELALLRGGRGSHLVTSPMPNVEDVTAHLIEQDVIWVLGGSVAGRQGRRRGVLRRTALRRRRRRRDRAGDPPSLDRGRVVRAPPRGRDEARTTLRRSVLG